METQDVFSMPIRKQHHKFTYIHSMFITCSTKTLKKICYFRAMYFIWWKRALTNAILLKTKSQIGLSCHTEIPFKYYFSLRSGNKKWKLTRPRNANSANIAHCIGQGITFEVRSPKLYRFSSVAQSCPTLCNSMPQHARPPCPSPAPRVHIVPLDECSQSVVPRPFNSTGPTW